MRKDWRLHPHFPTTRIFSFLTVFFLASLTSAQFESAYNHPELNWQSFETAHFRIHFHDGTDWTARRTAEIAETVYESVTQFYNYEPDDKTDLIIKDVDDISNGAAYYYDNKIEIWATPLDFPLRGNHDWLRDVITHEFTHIVSIQKSMKYSRNLPAFYFQVLSYEKEKRDDVVHGYPNVIASYPIPGTVIPMWLAEGMAQFMFPGTTNDFWDSHRDMLLRDRVIHDKILSFDRMGTFGKRGIGNESVYNQGYAFARYLTERFGDQTLPKIAEKLTAPVNFSPASAIKKATGVSGEQIHRDWVKDIKEKYTSRLSVIRQNEISGEILVGDGTTQFYPEFAGDSLLFYLSNKGMDYYSQTSLYLYDLRTKKSDLIQPKVRSKIALSPDGKIVYYSKSSKPNRHGSVFYDVYSYDLKKRKEKQITKFARAYNPAVSPVGNRLVYVTGKDGTSNLILLDIQTNKTRALTNFNNGEEIFSANWSSDGKSLTFDFVTAHGRDISIVDVETGSLISVENEPYDSRNPCFSPDGKWLYFASDLTGIFNIYRKSVNTGETELLTNVSGGAFMPTVNANGEVAYSLLNDSAFKIAIIRQPAAIDPAKAVYSDYADRIPGNMPISSLSLAKPTKYTDRFSKIFVSPRLTIDYGTIKPGFYFYSSEILDRFNIFGGASVNRIKDRDLFLLLEYHQWKPTFFFEFYNMSLSILNNKTTWRMRPMTLDYTFYLTEAIFGMSLPMGGINHIRLDMDLQKYRLSNDEKIPSEGYYSNGFSYDYYHGVDFRLSWHLKNVIRNVNEDMNPNNGVDITTKISRNYDKFMIDFGVYEDFGTLREIFRNNYYWKVEQEGVWHHRYPLVPSLVGNLKWKFGWISMSQLDSFFNLFAGGMPGLRGYPFYSIEGRNLFSLHYTWRVPLFIEKDIQLLSFNLQNAFIGTFFETGNAWNQVDGYPALDWSVFRKNPSGVVKSIVGDFKKDVGVELRLSGFSFYAYPTAISLDFVYGLDKFQLTDRQDKTHTYGKEWRSYLTILFGL